MTRFNDVRLAAALVCGLTLTAAPPTALAAQGPAHAPRLEHQTWPRWEIGAVTAPPHAMSPTPSDAVGGDVFLRSTLGAAGGFAMGVLAGVAVCWDRCGDGDFSAFLPAILMGFVGGSLGSAISGCSAVREPGCTAGVLPWSLLGMVAAVGGGGAMVTVTDNLLAGWISFSAIQGVLTARALR